MILSMTGFGEAQLEHEGQVYYLEIRSVNNRYIRAAVRLPDHLTALEGDVERTVRERLARGSINVHLHVRDLTAAAAQEINSAAIRAYVEQLRAAEPDDERVTIDLATLATLPGVCQPRELTEAERQRAWRTIQMLLVQAVDRLIAMRTAEGSAIAADLTEQCRQIRTRLDSIRTRAPDVIEEYRGRLAARIRELLAGSNADLAETDLLREVAVYAERSDVSEELSRLDAHLAQFERSLQRGTAAGRKLEFIAQEMLREANTVGSKAGDAQVARDIIDIKVAVDRIKEQVQNVE